MRYLFLLPALILVSCGGGSGESQSYSYYQKKDVEPKQLDLTIEASGEIEAIYSVEIKSKASGEILDLPAEVGDFVKKGTILKKSHLQPDWLVYKNQKITIENIIGEIKVTMEGIALKNGEKGDRILVRNISSNKKIEGFVNSDKKVTIFRKIY